MIISYKLNTLDFSTDIGKLICEIDQKLITFSKKKLDSLRYGAKINIDWNNYKTLVRYKDILHKKASRDECLRYYLIDDLISNVRQYLTSGKISKFNKCELEEISNNKLNIPKFYNVDSINYNFYGDQSTTVFNNYNYNSPEDGELIENKW